MAEKKFKKWKDKIDFCTCKRSIYEGKLTKKVSYEKKIHKRIDVLEKKIISKNIYLHIIAQICYLKRH